MNLIRNDWKHILRNKTSQKSLFNFFYYNNPSTRKIKGFLKLSNEKICLILQSNDTKHIKTFKFISWPSFMERYHKLSSDNWDNIFTNRFAKCSDGNISFHLV